MNPGMSPCLTSTSLVSGLTSRIWPWSWYSFVGAVRLQPVATIAATQTHRNSKVIS